MISNGPTIALVGVFMFLTGAIVGGINNRIEFLEVALDKQLEVQQRGVETQGLLSARVSDLTKAIAQMQRELSK